MMWQVRVWLQLDGEACHAGDIVCERGADGRSFGAFRYSAAYLRSNTAVALDPLHLPLRDGEFVVAHPGVPSVFIDSLPDDWGRRLLVRRHGIGRGERHPARLLLALAGSGLGALLYSSGDGVPVRCGSADCIHLDKLLAAAEKFEQGDVVDDEIAVLLAAGSSPGGARPKAVVIDRHSGIDYLAKFPSRKDDVDVVRIEAATMNLARRAGLDVPPCTLLESCAKPVLLVRRFDVSAAGRRHMISMQTLLDAQGYYVCRYTDMANILRRVAHAPHLEVARLFRQMVFNAIINNTDDHLKNFWMIYDREQGWRLSPAFDLLPNVGRNREHVLFFATDPLYPGHMGLAKIGAEWGVANSAEIVAQVVEALSDWRVDFLRFGVAEEQLRQFDEIDTHLLN